MIGLNGRKADSSVVERMAYSLQHRGPDEKGSFVKGSVGFGFRRLSILDLSPAGHQPMVSADGQKILLFNGEIYNYVELRKELQALGHVFKSSGDSEVLLTAYCEWGQTCLSKLNGMWAFLIYDVANHKIFGARDRFGVKPLYRYWSNDYVFFGSEIKAILTSGHYRHSINWKVASRFLVERRLDIDEETFYEGIEQVQAGSAFEIHFDGTHKAWRYWSLGSVQTGVIESPSSAFYELFHDAVRLRMRSDVPVGVCLSGGLDSTSILCSMANVSSDQSAQNPLEAFSYVSQEHDESRYIADTIEMTGAHLNKLELDPYLLLNKLERVLWYHDEPVHSMTALIGFELMGLAAKTGVKVVLNGQGADETIAGYHSFFLHHWGGLIRAGKLFGAWKEIKANAALLGGRHRHLFLRAIRHVLQGGIGRSSVYQALADMKHRKSTQRNSWFSPELLNHEERQRAHELRNLDDALKVSLEREPLPLYLRVEDRNSMAHSIEARLPFLDYRLVSFLFNLPAEWKMRGPWNKFILREAMKGHIPESVRTRVDKMGFPFPGRQWASTTLYEPVQDLLLSQEMKESGIYNLQAISRDLQRQRQGQLDVSCELFNVVQFQMWSTKLPRALTF
jgi:asparagine synthase (glutamine-hydrolysing)